VQLRFAPASELRSLSAERGFGRAVTVTVLVGAGFGFLVTGTFTVFIAVAVIVTVLAARALCCGGFAGTEDRSDDEDDEAEDACPNHHGFV
jgi:hypothetical protein